MAKYDAKLLKKMYAKMWEIRKFEYKIYEYFSKGLIKGPCHQDVGQEATAAATILALKDTDYVLGNHRSHGHALAKGIPVNAAMAEIFGKETGICKGRGGSMHICDANVGFLGANGIVGGGIPISGGVGLGIKMQGMKDTIAVCFFGDGAFNQGAAHETMNLSALWRTPVLFVCTNNLYGMGLPLSKGTAEMDLAKRAIGYGMKAITIDGNDPLKVYDTVKEARKYVIENGPMLIVENTYRWMGHAKADAQKYRTKEEVDAWKEKCPIKCLGDYMVKEKMATEEELEKIQTDLDKVMDDAVKFAQESPYMSADRILEDVYAQ